ncbi:6511_t:CDS:2, partial [Acaulospora colombiana]
MSLSSAAQSPVSSNDSRISVDDIIDDVLMEDQEELLPTIFDMVSSELTALGAIPLERFVVEDNPVELGCIPLEPTPITLPSSSKSISQESKNDHHQAVAKLYEACLRAFDGTDAISFDYKEDLGPNSRECILTITRPDGRKRSYTSGPYFSKKNEAKSHVAALAIGMNVMSFIQYGDINSRGRPNLTDSLDAQTRLKTQDGKGISYFDKRETIVNDPNVKAISDCCIEWRAGLVKPTYVHFSEPSVTVRDYIVNGKRAKIPSDAEIMALKQGCALKVEISPFTSRVYSVHHVYLTRAEAKAAVAAVAIEQGILEFIKYANGQTSPTVFIRELDDDASEHLNQELINETVEREKEVEIEATAVNVTLKKHQIPIDVMTLQAFTNSLPKPFPETPGLKPLGDGNPIGWLNSAVQSARGSKMNITWTYLSDAKRSHGRSYLVEPQFTKRSDAKSAVALLAISQNVGGWIAGISETIENLLPQDTKQKAYSLVPTLSHECKRAGLNQQPVYSFVHEEGVPVQYRTRLEARLAVVLQAYEEGILEFIRFKDKTPPLGYIRDGWRTKQARGVHDIRIEDQDIKKVQMDTRRHSYPQVRGVERYDRKQGPNTLPSSVPRGPRMAGLMRNRIGRYRQGDSIDMQERFAGQSIDERHPKPALFTTLPVESIGSTSDHHHTLGVTQNQDAESLNPGVSQYAIVRGHPSHVSENVHPRGGGPVPMMYEQTVQFPPIHPVPPPLLYPSGPFSHSPIHIPFASQPHLLYPFPPSLSTHHPSQPPGYPFLPSAVPPSVYPPGNAFGTGGHPNAPPFSLDTELQFNRGPPESYDGRPGGPNGPGDPEQFSKYGGLR